MSDERDLRRAVTLLPDRGDETCPNDRCFEFAVSFDVHADEVGTDAAVDVVLAELGIEQLERAA